MRKSVTAALTGALTVGALAGAALFGTPAHADSLATTDRAEAVERAKGQGWEHGSSRFHGLMWFDEFHGATDEVFPTARTFGVCEEGFGRFTGLQVGPVNGDIADFRFLAPVQAEGGYDQGGALVVESTDSLAGALGDDLADGRYEIRLSCLNGSYAASEERFAAKVLVHDGSWIYAGPLRK